MTRIQHLLARIVAAAFLLASAAACASGGAGTGSTGDGGRLADLPADQIVFQVSSTPGFLYLPAALANRPEITIYADGSAYLSSPAWIGDGAGPWGFRLGHVSPAVLNRLVADAERSGLFDGVDFGMPRIADVGGTRVWFRPDSHSGRTADAYALSISSMDSSLTPAQRAQRVALRAFIARLRHSVEISRGDWTPSRVEVTEVDLAGAVPAATAWPGPALRSLFARAGRGRCGELTGADARSVWAAALHNSTGVWSESGTAHRLVMRALLPRETACDGVR